MKVSKAEKRLEKILKELLKRIARRNPQFYSPPIRLPLKIQREMIDLLTEVGDGIIRLTIVESRLEELLEIYPEIIVHKEVEE